VADLPTVRLPRLPWYRKLSSGPTWHKFYLDPWLTLKGLQTAWRFKPDVIHAHLHEGCLIGTVISRILDIPLVFDCQGSLTGELLAHNFPLARGPGRKIWLAIEKWIDRQPAAILAQSTEMREELLKKFKVPSEKLFMAYDGVNTHIFQPNSHSQSLKQELGIAPERTVIIYLGGLQPHKGVGTLLEAFVEINRQYPAAFLLLMGYPEEQKYRQKVKQLGLESDVFVTGRIAFEEAPKYLALGDVAVAPKRSQTEANGKIYHYMASGLPTVAFDTVVSREILGNLGVYAVPEKDATGLAEAIISLLKDPKKRAKLAGQVRERAVKHYSWEQVAARIDKCYQQVISPWQLKVFAVSIRKQEKWEWLNKYLSPRLTSAARCLDIGSGVGTLSRLQEKLGGQWEFLETEPAAAVETKKIVSGKVFTQDIFDRRWQKEGYDIITALDVLEHVPDPRKFLQRITELLKPGGWLLLTTPADEPKFYLWRRLGERCLGITREAHGHVVDGFSDEQLEKLFNEVGLEMEKREQYSFFFTELVEIAYNSVYRALQKGRQSTMGYNLALSPASAEDVKRNFGKRLILRLAHPLTRGISRLDHFLKIGPGYEWGVVAKKGQ
jgi:glycosyltransferase involved in cell wall biosynthesis/SAM-dependent methyltransferase